MRTAAGIWPTPTHYVVALGDDVILRSPRSLRGRLHLTDVLEKLPLIEVVVPAPLGSFDAVAEHLHVARIPVWLLSVDMTDALAHVLDVRMRAASTLARALARLLEQPALRVLLDRPPPLPDQRQLRLL